jgi:hypothetical protein
VIHVTGYFDLRSQHPASPYPESTPDFAANGESLRWTLPRAAINAESRHSAIQSSVSPILEHSPLCPEPP